MWNSGKKIRTLHDIIYAGEDFQLYMLDSINNIISQYSISELIKAGLLSPIYKNQGAKNDSKNYRGIVVLPLVLLLDDWRRFQKFVVSI
jgi:hypothetical protein